MVKHVVAGENPDEKVVEWSVAMVESDLNIYANGVLIAWVQPDGSLMFISDAAKYAGITKVFNLCDFGAEVV